MPGIDDSADFNEVSEALTTIGLSDDEKNEVSKVVSAVLWLGNVAFQGQSVRASQPDRGSQRQNSCDL